MRRLSIFASHKNYIQRKVGEELQAQHEELAARTEGLVQMASEHSERAAMAAESHTVSRVAGLVPAMAEEFGLVVILVGVGGWVGCLPQARDGLAGWVAGGCGVRTAWGVESGGRVGCLSQARVESGGEVGRWLVRGLCGRADILLHRICKSSGARWRSATRSSQSGSSLETLQH